MKPLAALLLALTVSASPLAAQESEDAGRSLIGEGADMLLRGLIDEIRPPMEELAGIGAEMLPTFQLLAREMGPAFVDIFGRIDSIQNYEPPTLMPNGDIVLRRRSDAPEWTPPAAETPEPDMPADIEL